MYTPHKQFNRLSLLLASMARRTTAASTLVLKKPRYLRRDLAAGWGQGLENAGKLTWNQTGRTRQTHACAG